MFKIESDHLIDFARIAAIIACVGLLYSPSVGTVGLVGAVVAFLASGQAVVRLKRVLSRPSVYWAILFLGMVLIGTMYASVPWAVRWMDLFKWRTILWFILVLAIFDERRWRERLLIIFLAGTAVGAVVSSAAAAGWITLWRAPEHLLRISGTQGMAFACAALICVWAVLEKELMGPVPWVWPLLGGVYVTNIVFVTDSRSGYAILGLGLCVLLSWKASWRGRSLIVAGLLLALGLALTVSPRMYGKVQLAVTEWAHESELSGLTSFGIRRVWYLNTVEIIGEHWLAGVGTGGFPEAYREHIAGKYPADDWRSLATTDPHNQYLGIFTQQGIVGLAVFLAWLVAVGRDRSGPPVYRNLAVAILCGWCVTSLFSSHFRTFVEGHLLATFLGVLLAAESHPRLEPPVEPNIIQGAIG
ncbi:MAG: O-antigen ligase family protein [Nitrospira sp.]|nr:O-antigen ligase family protein [Nitrospira sp.]